MATTLYVSPTGNDANSGSVASPVRTIAHARELAVSGDTVVVDGDTNSPYFEIVVPKAGVTFKSAPGTRACMDGEHTRLGAFYTQVAANLPSCRFEGFEIRHYNRAGIYLSGTQGVNTGAVVDNCWIHHIYGEPGLTQNGIYLGFGNTTVTRCEISHIGHGNEAMGIWMWKNHNARIDGNLIYLCRKSCVREASGLSNQIINNYLLASWAGGECSVGVNALWANNVMAFNHINYWMKHSNKNGLALWGLTEATSPGSYRFWHNTLYRALEASIAMGGDPANGGNTREFDIRNNIMVGGADTAPNQAGQANVTKAQQSYLYAAPTTLEDPKVIDFNCYTTGASGFNRPANLYRAGSSLPYTTHELQGVRDTFGWEMNGAELDPELNDPANLDFDYPDSSPVKNMGAALPSPWGSQMGARGLPAPRISWKPHNLMGVSKTWAAGVWLGMFDQRAPSSSAWTFTPGTDQVVIDLGSVKDVTHFTQLPVTHNSSSNVKGHRWESAQSTAGPWTVLIEADYKDFGATTFWEEIPGGGTQCRYLRFTFLTNFSATGLTGTVGSTELGAANLTFAGSVPPDPGGENPPPDPGGGGPPITPTGDAYVGVAGVQI